MDRSHPATGCGRPLPPHTTLLSLSLRSLLRAYEPTASSLLVPAWNSQALLDAMAPNIIDYMTFDVLCQRKGAQRHTIAADSTHPGVSILLASHGSWPAPEHALSFLFGWIGLTLPRHLCHLPAGGI